MESRFSKLILDVSEGIIRNFNRTILHENKEYNLKLSYEQMEQIRKETHGMLHAIEFSPTQQLIFNKLNDLELIKFKNALVGNLNFSNNFSLFSKYEKVKNSGLTKVYYDSLIFDLSEFNNEKLLNSFPLKYLKWAKAPALALKTRFNMKITATRKEFIIAAFCQSIVDFGTHQDHLKLADELKEVDNKVIAAMRRPYGSIEFFSSAKEINSKAYFSYQYHIFTTLLGAKVVTEAFADKNLVTDMGREISLLLKEKDVSNLSVVNRATNEMTQKIRDEYAQLYYRKRS